MDATLAGIEVEATASGQLTIRWQSAGDDEIDIGVGPTPDAASHTSALRVRSVVQTARLTGVPDGRPYVSITCRGRHLIAAERRVRFDGVPNFRDLGGYPTSTGGSTRWGRLFRSSSLHKLTLDDLTVLDMLDIRAIFDLRREDERRRRPGPRPSDSLPMGDDPTGRLPKPTTLRDRANGERWLFGYYRLLVERSGPTFGTLLSWLAEPDRTPAVFHCAAGKDRTGLTAALLLTWLGVDRETVLDDYELTGRYLSAHTIPAVVERFVATGASLAAVEGVLSTPRWAMAQTLELIDADHDGIEAYLRGPAEMSAVALERLRDRFVD